MHRTVVGTFLGLLAAFMTPEVLAGYNVVNLGVLPGGSLSSAAAINASGDVVGSAESPTGLSHAFRTDNGGMVDLQTLPGGYFSAATGINASGTVVGNSQVQVGQSTWQTHAFRMESGGEMEDLGVPLNARASYATGVNSGGLISGYALMPGNLQRAFVSGGPGDFALLDTLRLGGNSFALAINDGGFVVGAADIAPGVYRAFVGSVNGPVVNLGTLPGSGGSSFATAVSSNGLVAGYAGEIGSFRAFRTRPDGTLEDLGWLPGVSSMTASGINALGHVVGTATYGGGTGRAFLYSELEGLIDLNKLIDPKLGWVLTSATAINDKGQISGTGQFQGQTLAFRLDPTNIVVPEPSALVLSAIGLTALLAGTRRRAARR